MKDLAITAAVRPLVQVVVLFILPYRFIIQEEQFPLLPVQFILKLMFPELGPLLSCFPDRIGDELHELAYTGKQQRQQNKQRHNPPQRDVRIVVHELPNRTHSLLPPCSDRMSL